MIYQWTASEKYGIYVGVTPGDDRKMYWPDPVIGDPLPPLDLWVPPVLEQYFGAGIRKRKLRPIGDAPGCVHFMISRRAADALSDILERHALLYPVRLLDDPDNDYYMVIAKTILDCLIVEQSTGAKTSLERDKRPFASLHTWTFDEVCVGENDLFMLHGYPSKLYVSQRFKDRVVAAGLKGFGFRTKANDQAPFVS